MKMPNVLKPGKKKIMILIILLVLGIGSFLLFGNKKKPVLQFAQVKRQDIRSTVSSSGNLTGKNTANLHFKLAGKLAYINVKEGDPVKPGVVIAGLDAQDLNIQLQQAQNTLRDKQAIAQKAEDDVKDHSADESFAQRVTRTTAQAARDSAFDSVKAAQRAFQDAVIVSPNFFGVVTKTSVQVPGQIVTSSDLIAQIVDMSAFYFDTDVDEADISKVAIGTPAEVTLDAYPGETFKGNVDQIFPQTKTTSSGATVVTVRIILDNPKIVFVNGLSGQSSIIYQAQFNALTIPQEALRDDNTVVIQPSRGILEAVKVEPGISSDTDIEIKSGLLEGEKVLLNPPSRGTKLN